MNRVAGRITKTEARKRYNNGERIWICPCNLLPHSSWGFSMAISKKQDYEPAWDGDDRNEFDSKVRDFEIYNCVDSETGRYAAYYLR